MAACLDSGTIHEARRSSGRSLGSAICGRIHTVANHNPSSTFSPQAQREDNSIQKSVAPKDTKTIESSTSRYSLRSVINIPLPLIVNRYLG